MPFYISSSYLLNISLAAILACILFLSEFSIYIIIFIGIGIPLLILSLKYSELTLAIFLSIGTIKGDPRLASVGLIDETVALAVLILISISFKFIFLKKKIKLPKEFFFYVPFLLIMLISLSYTPDFQSGFDKVSRFIILTGLAIVSPFFLLDSPNKMKRFFLAFVAISFFMSLNSIKMLGGFERLIAPSGLPMQLGYMSAVGIVIIWYFVLPNSSFFKKLIGISILLILFIALVGSGARSATIALTLCIFVSFFLYKRLIPYFFVITGVALFLFPFTLIPDSAFKYLDTIIHYNLYDLFGFRTSLMKLAWNLTKENPLFGVGIGGYSFYSPNPLIYNWAHNGILEISSEIGLMSALAFCSIIFCSFYVTIRQIKNSNFKYRQFSRTILALLIIGFITMLSHGDINSLRPLWLYMSLPFVLREF